MYVEKNLKQVKIYSVSIQLPITDAAQLQVINLPALFHSSIKFDISYFIVSEEPKIK